MEASGIVKCFDIFKYCTAMIKLLIIPLFDTPSNLASRKKSFVNCLLSNSFQKGQRMDFPPAFPQGSIVRPPQVVPGSILPSLHHKLLGKSSNTKVTKFFASSLLDGFCIATEKLMEALLLCQIWEHKIVSTYTAPKVSFQVCSLQNPFQ